MGAAHYQSLVVRWLDSIPLPVEIDRKAFTVTSRASTSSRASVDEGRRSVGTPEDVARSVERWQRRRGRPADLRHAQQHAAARGRGQESIETFGREVIPAFDTDPVHSTTRQRDAQGGQP